MHVPANPCLCPRAGAAGDPPAPRAAELRLWENGGCEEQMLLLHRVSFYAADALSLVYFMETFKLDGIQHPGKPIAAAGSSGVYIEPIQVSDCKEFNRGFIFFFLLKFP